MEEILASIRRIISEDEEADEGEQPADADSEAATAEAGAEEAGANEEDVLDLTQMVTEDGDVVDLAEGKEPETETTAEADEQEEAPEETEPEAAPADENELVLEDAEPDEAEPAAEEAATPPAAGDDDSLVSPPTAAAATESFEELAKAVTKEEGIGTPLASIPGKTLEDIVKELLCPMLKEWLDQNLPSLTEKLVRKEVERAARRAEEL